MRSIASIFLLLSSLPTITGGDTRVSLVCPNRGRPRARYVERVGKPSNMVGVYSNSSISSATIFQGFFLFSELTLSMAASGRSVVKRRTCRRVFVSRRSVFFTYGLHRPLSLSEDRYFHHENDLTLREKKTKVAPHLRASSFSLSVCSMSGKVPGAQSKYMATKRPVSW